MPVNRSPKESLHAAINEYNALMFKLIDELRSEALHHDRETLMNAAMHQLQTAGMAQVIAHFAHFDEDRDQRGWWLNCATDQENRASEWIQDLVLGPGDRPR